MNITPIDKSRLAKTDQELLNLVASDADWIARTADDLKQLRAAGSNPFAKLPEKDFNEFVAGLCFEKNGVGGGYYKPLMNSLMLSEIHDVFAHFGMSMELFSRAENRSCLECKCPDCDFSFWHFCSSVCSHKTESA
jgi:hypothetical protein